MKNLLYDFMKNLNEICKLQIFKKLNVFDIKKIWLEKHKNSHPVGVLSKAEFLNFSKNSQFKSFLIPTKNGFLYSQLQDVVESKFQAVRDLHGNSGNGKNRNLHFIVTFLNEFKEKRELAKPIFAFSVFSELIEEKELALTRGDLLRLDFEEGTKISKFLRRCYGNSDEKLFQELKNFNTKPEEFDYKEFLKKQIF